MMYKLDSFSLVKTSRAWVGWEVFSLFQNNDETIFFGSFEVLSVKLRVIYNVPITWKVYRCDKGRGTNRVVDWTKLFCVSIQKDQFHHLKLIKSIEGCQIERLVIIRRT